MLKLIKRVLSVATAARITRPKRKTPIDRAVASFTKAAANIDKAIKRNNAEIDRRLERAARECDAAAELQEDNRRGAGIVRKLRSITE